jgi:hypothetical protein
MTWRPTKESVEVWGEWEKQGHKLDKCHAQRMNKMGQGIKTTKEFIDIFWKSYPADLEKKRIKKYMLKQAVINIFHHEPRIYPYDTWEEDVWQDVHAECKRIKALKNNFERDMGSSLGVKWEKMPTALELIEIKENSDGTQIEIYRGPIDFEEEDKLIELIDNRRISDKEKMPKK